MLPSLSVFLGRSSQRPPAGVFSGSPFKPASHLGVSLLFEDIKPAPRAGNAPPTPPSRRRTGICTRTGSGMMADNQNADRTFAIVKPDALTPFKYQQIDALIKLNEFETTRQKLVWLTEEQAAALFPERAAEADGRAWLEYITCAPCLAMELAKPDAPLFWQLTMGTEVPGDGGARDGDSIRGILAIDRIRNAVDGSQEPEDAARQLKLVFSDAVPALPYDNFLMERADDANSTLALLKPDVSASEQAVARIIGRAVARGYTIKSRVDIALSRAQAAAFYAEYEGMALFDELVAFMASGPVIALLLEGDDVIRGWRTMIGPADPVLAQKQAPQSIRALLGTGGWRNAVHGSDSPAAAQREIGFFFFPRIQPEGSSNESTPSAGSCPLSPDDKKKKKKQQKKRRNKRKQAVTANMGGAAADATATGGASDDSDDEPDSAGVPEPAPEAQSAPITEATVKPATEAIDEPAHAADAAPDAETPEAEACLVADDAADGPAPDAAPLVCKMEALAVSDANGEPLAAGASEAYALPNVDRDATVAKEGDGPACAKQPQNIQPAPAAMTATPPHTKGVSGEKPSPFGCVLASSPFLKADRQSGQEPTAAPKRFGRIKSPFLGNESSAASSAEPAAADTKPEEPEATESALAGPAPEEPTSEATAPEEPVPAEPESDEPESDEPESDEPESDEPESDEPESDEPESDEPVLEEPVPVPEQPEPAESAPEEHGSGESAVEDVDGAADAEQKQDLDAKLNDKMEGLCIVAGAQGDGRKQDPLPVEAEAPTTPSKRPQPAAPTGPRARALPPSATTPARSAPKAVPASATAARTGRPAGGAAPPATASRRATLGPAPATGRARAAPTVPTTPGVVTRSAARAAGTVPAAAAPRARPPAASSAVRRTPAAPPRAAPTTRGSATPTAAPAASAVPVPARPAARTPATPTAAASTRAPARPAPSVATPRTLPRTTPERPAVPASRAPSTATAPSGRLPPSTTPARSATNGSASPARAPAAPTASPRPATRSMASRPPIASTASSRARAAIAAAAKAEATRPAAQPKAPATPTRMTTRATAPTAASRAKAAAASAAKEE